MADKGPTPWFEQFPRKDIDDMAASQALIVDPGDKAPRVLIAVRGTIGFFTLFYPGGSIEQFEVAILRHRWAKLVKQDEPK